MSEALQEIGTEALTVARELGRIEARIDAAKKQTMVSLLEIGRCLNEAKDRGLVPHGQWEQWAADQTGMAERTRQRIMQAAREIPAGSAMERLEFTKAFALLALPEGDREGMAEKAEAEGLSLRDLQGEVARLTDRTKQLEGQAALDKDAAAKREGKALADYEAEKKKAATAADKVKGLEAQLKALKEAPPAKEEKGKGDGGAGDEAEAERIRQEARKEAVRELQAEIATAERKRIDAEERAEELKRKLAVADPAVAKFGVMFGEVQELMNKLLGLIGEVAEPDKRERLRKALATVLDKYSEGIREA